MQKFEVVFPNLPLLGNFFSKIEIVSISTKMSFGVSVLYVCMNKGVFALGGSTGV